MALHFSKAEFEDRIARTVSQMRATGLSGMLLFRQESMYWLTGYDTAGYSQFQCLWLGADARMMLLTRSSDVRQASVTSIIEDVRLWRDSEGANPAAILREELALLLAPGTTVGVEYASSTLNAQRGKLVDAAFDDVTLVDASELVSKLRAVKSEAELAYVREAGRLADETWRAVFAECRPGASESDMLAAAYATTIRAGGDPAAGRFVCGAGDNALLCRYFTGKGTIGQQDQITVEFGSAYRHYHAALMRTVVAGDASERQRHMHRATVEALQACQALLRPGNTYGDLFAAHASVLDRHGYAAARLNACGYSLGACFPPTWMDWPMVYANNPVPLTAGMVVFLHMILFDDASGLSMCLGETFIVTDGAPERLSALDHDLPMVR